MNKRLLTGLVLAAFGGGVSAKLPAPDDAAKAKAAETAAKAAWQAKVDTYQLCKSQDKIAAKFGSQCVVASVDALPRPAALRQPCVEFVGREHAAVGHFAEHVMLGIG